MYFKIIDKLFTLSFRVYIMARNNRKLFERDSMAIYYIYIGGSSRQGMAVFIS